MNIFRKNNGDGNINPDNLNNQPDPNSHNINPLDYIEKQLKMNELEGGNNGLSGDINPDPLSRQSPYSAYHQFPDHSRNDPSAIDRDGDGIPDQFDSIIDRDRDGIPDQFDNMIDRDGDWIPDSNDPIIDANLDGVSDIDLDV